MPTHITRHIAQSSLPGNYRNSAHSFAYWALLVGIVFYTVYPTCNWLSAQRDKVHHFYFDWELDIPLVPEFLWAYLSMYALFLSPPLFLNPNRHKRLAIQLIVSTIASGFIFLAFPSTLGFTRVPPDSALYHGLFQFMFSIDRPYNMWPSLHVVYSALILLMISDQASKKVKAGAWIWLTMISLSTILVHQHHLLDIILAFVLVWIVRTTQRKGEPRA